MDLISLCKSSMLFEAFTVCFQDNKNTGQITEYRNVLLDTNR